MSSKQAEAEMAEAADMGEGEGGMGEAPPGSMALKDMHDYYSSHKDLLQHHRRRQENPEVKDMMDRHEQTLAELRDEARDTHNSIYGEEEPIGEEKAGDQVEEDFDPELRETPESTGEGPAGQEVEGGGDRVETEERKSARKSSRKVAPKKKPFTRKSWQEQQDAAAQRTLERLDAQLANLTSQLLED